VVVINFKTPCFKSELEILLTMGDRDRPLILFFAIISAILVMKAPAFQTYQVRLRTRTMNCLKGRKD
jgi:hypothetical protein